MLIKFQPFPSLDKSLKIYYIFLIKTFIGLEYVMLIFTFLLSILLLFIIIRSYKDNVMFSICLHYFGLGLFMFFSVMFLCQIYQYPTLLSMDTHFFMTLTDKPLSPYTLSKLILISHIIIMLSNFILLSLMVKRKFFIKGLYIILMLAFGFLNWPSTRYMLMIKSHIHTNGYLLLSTLLRPLSSVVFLGMILIPIILIIINYKRTYPQHKRFCINLSVISLLIIVILEIATFFLLPTSAFCSYNLDDYSFPQIIFKSGVEYFESFSANMIIIMMIILNIALILCLIASITKPFRFFIHSNHVNVKALKKLDTNILMMFHTYKNAFWGISELSKQALNNPAFAHNNLVAINKSSKEMFVGVCNSIEMLSFTPESIHTVDLVESIKKTIEKNPINGITFALNSPYDAVLIKINENHIIDILQNITLNSIDAIQLKGNDDGKITYSIHCEPGSVELKITDNGCGIKHSQLKNMFSYFNSTKHSNKHFGIGLVFVKKVINAYNGHLSIKSVYGKYTTVTILFPLPMKE